MGLGDDEGGVREARLRHVRAEQPLGDDLGLYPQPLSTPDLVRHRVAAVKRVQAARHAVREPDETLAGEPEIQLDGESDPLIRNVDLRREPDRERDFWPEVAEAYVFRLGVSCGEPPVPYRAFAGVAPEPELLYAAGVALETVPVAGIQSHPLLRGRRDTNGSSRARRGRRAKPILCRYEAMVEKGAA